MIDLTKYAKANGFIILKADYDYFLDNLVNDTNLTTSEKIKFFDYLMAYGGSSNDDFKYYCETYFRKNQLLGSSLEDPDKLNPFVRIIIEENLFGRIRQLIGIRYDKIRPLIMEMCISTDKSYRNAILSNFLDNIVLPINYIETKNSLNYLGVERWKYKTPPRLKDAKIEAFLQWSFPIPITENIFETQDHINNLDCRAGLVDSLENLTATKILFVHNLKKDLKPCKPTCFDAEFYQQFSLGGVTKPLEECKDKIGFEEFIHKANKFKNLSGEFYEIYKN